MILLSHFVPHYLRLASQGSVACPFFLRNQRHQRLEKLKFPQSLEILDPQPLCSVKSEVNRPTIHFNFRFLQGDTAGKGEGV